MGSLYKLSQHYYNIYESTWRVCPSIKKYLVSSPDAGKLRPPITTTPPPLKTYAATSLTSFILTFFTLMENNTWLNHHEQRPTSINIIMDHHIIREKKKTQLENTWPCHIIPRQFHSPSFHPKTIQTKTSLTKLNCSQKVQPLHSYYTDYNINNVECMHGI